MGQTVSGLAACHHFVTKCELFEAGVTLFAKAFIGTVFGQNRLTLKYQVSVDDIRSSAPIKLSL